MTSTKPHTYSEQQVSLAAIFKALAHPARIAILEFLMKKDACVCGDIVAELPLAQSTVSQHLKVLKNAGLIHGEADGVYSCYAADEQYCCTAMSIVIRFMQNLPGCC